MAHWISSKLKAAETLLQQIDQQAAESLGKNEKPQLGEQLGQDSLQRAPDTKPLLKDQLKKKARENVIHQSTSPIDKTNSNAVVSDMNHDMETRISKNLKSRPSSTTKLADSDWTELLSLPDTEGLSGGGKVNHRNSEISSVRSLKKDSKKVGNSGAGINLSVVDGKSKKARTNGVLKSPKESDFGLGNQNNADGNEKESNAEDVTPSTSSAQSPSSESELDKKGSVSALVLDHTDMIDEENTEGVNRIVSGQMSHLSDKLEKSFKMVPVSHEIKMDTKLVKNGDMIEKTGSKKSRVASQSSSSSKNVSSSRSGEESNTETDSTSSSDSESEREIEESRKRRQQILAERAAAKADEAIKERENLVAKLEGEKLSLEKVLEERAKQQVHEASELETAMMETMEAAELEKQKHNHTRMEALPRLAKLESANVDLARSLAHVQKNLEAEVDHVSDLRQQIHMKEAAQEELRRKIAHTQQKGIKLQGSKGVEFELEMLEAEYSFINDKMGKMQDQAKTLETSIETTRREVEYPTEVETELKRRLNQLTDHLIRKQAQVETLSSEKAMLLLRIEAVSRSLEENNSMVGSVDFPSTSMQNDSESAIWQLSNTKLKPIFKEKMLSSHQHLGSIVRQLDSLFCASAVFLRRNTTARIWAIVYFVCLHVWVIYIMTSHSSTVAEESRSGAVYSLENINNTAGGV